MRIALFAGFLFLQVGEVLGLQHGLPYKLDLDMRVASATVQAQSAFHALTLVSMSGVVIAAELKEYSAPRFTFSLDGKPLRAILDEIVRQAPEYTWRSDGNIIRFELKDGRERGRLAALNAEVPEFVSSELSVTGTILRLATAARDNGAAVFGQTVSEESIRKSMDSVPPDAVVAVRFGKGTLREGLDQIVLADPPALWLTKLAPDGRLLVVGQSTHEHREESPVNRRLRERGPLNPRALPGTVQAEHTK